MWTIEKLTEYLLKEFDSVYCYNCKFEDTNSFPCDECDRRNMNWRLREDSARGLAEEIIAKGAK